MKAYKVPEGGVVKLIVVSNKNFSPVFGKAADFEMEFLKTQRLSTLVTGKPTLVYLDMDAWENHKSIVRAISSIIKQKSIRVGLIDSKNMCQDPAVYFQMGCVDFLTPSILQEHIRAARYRQALSMAPFRESDFDLSTAERENLYSANGWEGIKQGKEYMFGFMFVETDNIAELQNSLGPSGCQKFSVDLRDHLSEYLSVWDGYVWIWKDFGGAILFPFDGSHYHALEAGMELVINQEYIRFSSINRQVTFRVALHLGETVFHSRGKTGDIVSDSVNSLFHMGDHFKSAGSLHLTEDVRPFIPHSLESYFICQGQFEGREIFKLKNRL